MDAPTPIKEVNLDKADIDLYKDIIGTEELQSIKDLADGIKGRRVIHINTTDYGGGVAELLYKIVPLMTSVGLDAHWRVVGGPDEFFSAGKLIEAGFFGLEADLTPEVEKVYLETNQLNAKILDSDTDWMVIHDAQPLPLRFYHKPKRGKWAWRTHSGFTNPKMHILRYALPFIEKYDAVIMTMQDYADILKAELEGRPNPRMAIITPSIDPLSEKSKPLSEKQINKVLETYDIDPDRPLITQISRFDPKKGIFEAIDAYQTVKKEIPDVQFVLAGGMAPDDPGAMKYYEKTLEYAKADGDIHALTNFPGGGDIEVNALQSAADVVLQKSVAEGFGITITEALWKGVPVIASNTGGIRLQILDGVNGFLIDTTEQMTEKIAFLLKNPEIAREMGEKGKEHVKKNFLVTTHVKKYLQLFVDLG